MDPRDKFEPDTPIHVQKIPITEEMRKKLTTNGTLQSEQEPHCIWETVGWVLFWIVYFGLFLGVLIPGIWQYLRGTG